MTNNITKFNNNTNINKSILPVFFIPVNKKFISDNKKSKENLNILNPENNLTSSTFSVEKDLTESQITGLFLKGISEYNNYLNDYTSKWNNLELILNLKNDEFYKFNLRLSNLLYCINRFYPKRFFPGFKLRCLFFFNKFELFLPKNILKLNPKTHFGFRFRLITKTYKNPKILNKNNIIDNIFYWNMLIDLNRLLLYCKAEINNLDLLIYKKKKIIEQIKKNYTFQEKKNNIIFGVNSGFQSQQLVHYFKNINSKTAIFFE
jgi:hypothetical protein